MKKLILILFLLVILAYTLYAQPGPIQVTLSNLTQFVNQTAWRIFYSNGDGDVTELALGTDGQYLKSNGASSAPSWTSAGTFDDIYLGEYLYHTGDLDTYIKMETDSMKVYCGGQWMMYLKEGLVEDYIDVLPKLKTTSITASVSTDFSGAPTTIPWTVSATAAPTTEGQAIWESDTDELTVGDGAASIVIAAKTNTVFCFNVHDIDDGMDDIKMPFTRATTITKVTAFVTGGTNVVGRLYEVDGDGDDADAVGVESSDWTFTAGETEDASFNNATFDAGDYIQWDTTSVSGSVTGFMLSVEGYEI